MKSTLLVLSIITSIFFFNETVIAEDATKLVSLSLPLKGNDKWLLKLPSDGTVVYHGVYSFDEAGTGMGNGMLYPAPSVAGLVAAIVTHGLLISSAKSEQKNKLQMSADQVLSSYENILSNFKYTELLQRTVEKVSANPNLEHIKISAYSDSNIVIESSPTFMLTQDKKTIIVNDDVVIHLLGQKPEIIYKNSIRVISTAEGSSDPTSYWTSNDGENIKDVSAQLHAQSIDIAFRSFLAAKSAESEPYQTIHYSEGLSDKIERAQIISKDCDRVLIRNLRGMLISAPVPKSSENNCDSMTGV